MIASIPPHPRWRPISTLPYGRVSRRLVGAGGGSAAGSTNCPGNCPGNCPEPGCWGGAATGGVPKLPPWTVLRTVTGQLYGQSEINLFQSLRTVLTVSGDVGERSCVRARLSPTSTQLSVTNENRGGVGLGEPGGDRAAPRWRDHGDPSGSERSRNGARKGSARHISRISAKICGVGKVGRVRVMFSPVHMPALRCAYARLISSPFLPFRHTE